MTKEDTLRLEGLVSDTLPNLQFKVELENGMVVMAYLCGKMKQRNIRVMVGDTVTLEMSPYDLSKARIVYRGKLKAPKRGA
jgi:translation initiation factor IF-1